VTVSGGNLRAVIERWAALLPPATESIPHRCKMTPETFAAILQHSRPKPADWRTEVSGPRFDAIPVDVDPDLDAPWIVYDQNGDEMMRGEW
jgi:hypothetical protein